MAADRTNIHLVAGGIGGTAGAVLTCPLEVVKTRLQSSGTAFRPVYISTVSYVPAQQIAGLSTCSACVTTSPAGVATVGRQSVGLFKCFRHIIQQEGPKALFKGLGPNLIGVAPSRAVYFYSYARAKRFFNSTLSPETPIVHLLSAGTAGFTASTLTNPIWFVKTRIQIDQKVGNTALSVSQCIRDVYRTTGIRGFYKGITASYYGILETAIHFVIYEGIKARLREYNGKYAFDDKSLIDFVQFMCAGACSKTCATCIAYPHEVARTRLREEGTKYRHFWQTLALVFREEGYRGLYRGLWVQLLRQIPNTAVMMSTYEGVVYLCEKYFPRNDSDCDNENDYYYDSEENKH